MTIAATQGATSTVVDIPDYIDRQPVGAFQIRVLLICAAVLFIDGFDYKSHTTAGIAHIDVRLIVIYRFHYR